MSQMGAPPLLFIEEEVACSEAQSAPKRPGLQQVTNQAAAHGRWGSTDPRSVWFLPLEAREECIARFLATCHSPIGGAQGWLKM